METTWNGYPAIELKNTELECLLLPTFGNNLIRLYDKVAKREVLRVPSTPAELSAKPGHYGTPLMLPPNRIRRGAFKFNHRSYQMEINTPEGNHIHGFLRNRAWKVVGFDQKSVTTEFLTSTYPEILEGYPHELRVECRYDLDGPRLLQTIKIENLSKSAAPVGFGLHTWFLIDGEPQRWKLHAPATDIWELDNETMPNGKFNGLGKFEGINQAMSLAGSDFDTIFRVGDKRIEAKLLRDDGYTITYRPSSEYLHWVFYTKGIADKFICLEPYTWVTNAPNLDLPPEVTGMRSIESSQTLKLTVDLFITR